MKFTKMHGCGNDYVYVNLFEEKIADPAKVSIAVSDRHFGIGSDGLITIGLIGYRGFQDADLQCGWLGGGDVWKRNPLCRKICI